MDNRLIPPSHFGPQEQDSLEESSSTTCETESLPIHPAFLGTKTDSYLRPPDVFASNTRPQLVPPVQNLSPGHYQTPPHIARIHRFSGTSKQNQYQLSQNSNEEHHYSELLRLQAQNEALKSIIQCKKAKLSEQETKSTDSGHCGNNSHQAVIEHQTQHIARLQKDIDAQSTLITKREAEISQYESAVVSKEKECKNFASSVERLETMLDKKKEEERCQQQEIESLHDIVRNLRKEKDDMLERFKKEKQENETSLTKKMKQLTNIQDVEKCTLEEKITRLENQQKIQITDLKNCHQKELDGMTNKFSECQQKHSDALNDLQNDLEKTRKKLEIMTNSLNKEISKYEKLQTNVGIMNSSHEESKLTNEKQQERINQLQTYIGEQQNEDYQRSQWKNHRKQFEDTIVALQTEKENYDKTLELQNIRLQSITKILTTQEEAIHANTKAFSAGNIRGNPEHVVIRRWREKVFELMIQLKSNEVTSKETENKYRRIENDLRDQLEEERRVSVILENQLCECKAQLEMQENSNASLSKSYQTISEKLKGKEKNVTELEEAVVTMSESVSRATEQLCEEFQNKFSALAEKTIHQEQRILFANNRLRTVHDLLVRRDNIWKSKLKQMKVETPKCISPETMQIDDISLRMERPDLIAEIEQLTKERDVLSQRLTSDSAVFDNATANFKQRESELENMNSALQHDLQQKSEEFAELKKEHDSIEEKLKDCERTVSDATDSAKAVQENVKSEIEQKLDEAWKTWDAEKRELEKRLNESQREHARTVVTSRQSERNAVKEKKRATEDLQAVAYECRIETEKLKTKIKTLKQDNNLLMTTLRQQGLLSTFKSARAQAKILVENDASPKNTTTKQISTNQNSLTSVENLQQSENQGKFVTYDGPSTSNHPAEVKCALQDRNVLSEMKENNENMEDMLKDLVVLTENILDDSD